MAEPTSPALKVVVTAGIVKGAGEVHDIDIVGETASGAGRGKPPIRFPQLPRRPGRQLSQDLFVLTQEQPLQVPDLLQRQQAMMEAFTVSRHSRSECTLIVVRSWII